MPWKDWSEIRAKASPETLERAARKTEAMLASIELNELRQARKLTQEELADRLGVKQANVSKMERRLDMHVSTLRDVIEAMGGEMRITAHFPDADYLIDQFSTNGDPR
ncbi:MAG TPA: XRE family transcriptional regulator [Longimicrobiaceae bacterium]|nr:XRE family transcriptional regulator [Longimicrobiaceae bacterium]